MTASTTEETVEVAGLQVRWLKVIVSGHTVQQVLLYDVAEAEAVHGRPFDEELDHDIKMAMFAMDRIWMDETMHRVASATSHVADGTCIRTAKIEHCNEIEPGSASWVITRADGRPVETEPWSCVPGTPPISHLELTVPDDALDSSKLPLGVAAFLECETRADEYFREYKKVLGHAYGIDESDDAAEEPPMTRLRHETRPNGRQVQIDDRGWALKKNGQRDLRHTWPVGVPLFWLR